MGGRRRTVVGLDHVAGVALLLEHDDLVLSVDFHRLERRCVGPEAVHDLEHPPLRVVTDDGHRADAFRDGGRELVPRRLSHEARLRHRDRGARRRAVLLQERVVEGRLAMLA
eukprot:2305085-Prymnesium_polylepis.1